MAEKTWATRELPVLDWLVQYFDEPDARAILLTDITEAMAWEEADVTRALARLAKAQPAYITWPDIAETDVPQYVTGVTERALTATQAWPSAESAADSMLAALRDAIDRTDDPEEKTKLQRLLAAAGSVGTSVLGGVLTAASTTGLGLG